MDSDMKWKYEDIPGISSYGRYKINVTSTKILI